MTIFAVETPHAADGPTEVRYASASVARLADRWSDDYDGEPDEGSRRKHRPSQASVQQNQRNEYVASLRSQFPHAPHAFLAAIASTSLQKGRVGYDMDLDLDNRARIATVAWIRHRLTHYEDLWDALDDEASRGKATKQEFRRDVAEAIDAVLVLWGPSPI